MKSKLGRMAAMAVVTGGLAVTALAEVDYVCVSGCGRCPQICYTCSGCGYSYGCQYSGNNCSEFISCLSC
jgi:hypothetical protein